MVQLFFSSSCRGHLSSEVLTSIWYTLKALKKIPHAIRNLCLKSVWTVCPKCISSMNFLQKEPRVEECFARPQCVLCPEVSLEVLEETLKVGEKSALWDPAGFSITWSGVGAP